MTPTQLQQHAELQALEQKATPGPWKYDLAHQSLEARHLMYVASFNHDFATDENTINGAFTAALRNHALPLLNAYAAELEASKAENAAKDKEIERLKEFEWKYQSLSK